MLKNNLIYKTKFKVRGHDVDIHQKCSPLGVMRYMHEGAMEHVLKFKVSAKELIKENRGWVVLNQVVEFLKPAYLGDELYLTTFPSRLEKIFTFRDYVLMNQSEDIIAQSRGRFIMMDLNKRQLMKIPPDIYEMLVESKPIYELKSPQRFRLKKEKLIKESSFIIRYSDLDYNKHVGNQSYYKWIFDSFNFDFLSKHELVEIQLEFKEESHIGQKVNSKIYSQDHLVFEHELLVEGRISALALSMWKES